MKYENEQEKTKHSQFLEFAVSLRTAELEERNAELKASNKELESLVYAVSHDIKQPIRTILNFSSLLKDGKIESLDDEGKLYLDFVANSAAHLHELVNDMLSYSEIGSYGNREEVDVNALVKNVIAELGDEAKDAQFEIAELPMLKAFPTELTDLFENLINNAIKYRREGVPPVVSITCEEKEDEFLFSIQDNGRGFNANCEREIFGMFRRLENASDSEGTGIGLAQCKKIVELHEGVIWAKSQQGAGSTFYFTIPHVLLPL